MVNDGRVEIPGSAPKARSAEIWLSPVEPDQQVSATIILRRGQNSGDTGDLEEQLMSGRSQPISRDEAAQTLGADPDDLRAVRSFLEQHGLRMIKENAAARTLHVEGTVEQMSEAFGVRLGWFEDAEGRRHMSYEGVLSVPQSLSGIILAVLGLDQRPIATHHGVSAASA